MSGRTPVKVAHALRDVGISLRSWRQLHGLSQAQVAERARISEQTVRALEAGKGSVSSESLFRVFLIIGLVDNVVETIDPLSSPLGRARLAERLPQRVRKQASS